MVVSRSASTEANELADIGVLFVHGIGQQKRGDTLIAAGDAVHEFLARWFTTGNVAKGTSRAVLMPDPADPAAPAHVYASMEQTFPDGTTTEANWLMAESWWAESFPPPKFFDLAVWAFQVMPWTLATHYGRGVRRAWLGTSAASGFLQTSRWFVAFLARLAQLLIVFAAIPLLVALVAIIALIGAIPIGGVRAFAGGAQRILSASLGDSFIFVRKPIQASAIHETVRRDLEWLGERSHRVAVVAHSQGAAVAHEVIKDDPRHDIVAFISLGSGLGKLLELRNERETVQIKQRTPKETSAAPFAGSAGMALVAWALYYGFGTNAWAASAFAGVFGLLLVGVATQSAWVGRVPKIDEVALPGWIEWIDLFAAKDPVPHGRLFDTDEVDPACGILSWVESRFDPEYGPREKSLPRSGVAHNYGSFTSDHNAYWLNRDGVVPMVALAIAKYSPGLRLDEIDPLDQSRVVAGALRRRFRVRWLQFARWMTVAAGAFALLGLGWKDQLLELSRPTLVGARTVSSVVPGWALDWSENTVVGVFTLVVPVLLIYVGLSYLWRWWGYVESHELYRRGFPDPFPAQMIIFLLVLALLVEVGILIGLGHRLGIVPGIFSVAALSFTVVLVVLMTTTSVTTPLVMRLWRGVFGDGRGVITGPPGELLGYRRLMLLVGVPALVVFPVVVVDPDPPTSVTRVFGAYGLGLVLVAVGSLLLHTRLVRSVESSWTLISRSGPPELILSKLADGAPVAEAQLHAAAEMLLPWLDFYAESLRQIENDPPAIAESGDWAKMARTARFQAQRATEVARLLADSDAVLAGRLAIAAAPLHPAAVELAVEMRMLEPEAAVTAMQRLARAGPRRDRSRARRWLHENQTAVTADPAVA